MLLISLINLRILCWVIFLLSNGRDELLLFDFPFVFVAMWNTETVWNKILGWLITVVSDYAAFWDKAVDWYVTAVWYTATGRKTVVMWDKLSS